ncbi:hypothetical protein AAZX31_07G127600 [Glycine max]
MVVLDAIKMINDALRQWRTERSLGAFRMGLSVLKTCITNELTEGKEPKLENSKGMAVLAMSTLLFESYLLCDCLVTCVFVLMLELNFFWMIL